MKNRLETPLKVMIKKEIADHLRSWRFGALVGIILLTYAASMYVSVTNIKTAVTNTNDPDHLFFYLKLLTVTDQTIPPCHIFLGFLAPLLGISLGFDAINAEANQGTLTRLLAQPLYRDNVLLAKFVSALIIVGCLFLSLVLLMIGGGLLLTGVRIEPQEIIRILGFVVMTIFYVGLWLGISITLSVLFKQAATSALVAIGLWLFFTIFYQVVVTLIAKLCVPEPDLLTREQFITYNNIVIDILRVAPNHLYNDGVTTLLMPSVRSLGPLTMEQMTGAIPSPLPLGQSLMIVWPQVSGLMAATIGCFAIAYASFMRREIRG